MSRGCNEKVGPEWGGGWEARNALGMQAREETRSQPRVVGKEELFQR